MKTRVLALLFAALASSGLAQSSSVPTLISYSGKVVDASGNPITGQRLMVFRIWDGPTDSGAANRKWSEQQTVVLSAGEFSVLIGAGSPVASESNSGTFADVFNPASGTSSRYLGVTVDDGNSATVDPEISPRQQVVTTAYAFRSRLAETVASGAITSASFGSGAVNEAALGTSAVSSGKVADNAITAAKIADGSVSTAKLADGAVTAAKLAVGGISGAQIADGTLGTSKVADSAITSAKILDGTVALQDLGANSVDTSKIVDGAVTLLKHADNSVNSAKIVDGSVATVDLADGSITTAKIADGAVQVADIGTGAVTLQKIAADAVDRTRLHPTVRRAIPKAPEIYDQAVSPNYTASSGGDHIQFVPVDIERLGNDADGCRILVIARHRGDGSSITEWGDEWREAVLRIHLTQRGFIKHGEYPQWIPGTAHWTWDSGTYHDYFYLGITDLSTHWDWAHRLGNTGDNWTHVTTFYPGAWASGAPSPWNQHQPNNASNSNCGGPQVSMNINSITAENGVVTVVTRTGHAIQKNDTVALSGITGAGGASLPDPNGNRVVTEVPSRNSFQFSLAGANGTYSGGWVPEVDSSGFEILPAGGYSVVSGYAQVAHKPTYSKFRIWFAVHRHTSTRIIVFDN
jgi:hypothetical protein